MRLVRVLGCTAAAGATWFVCTLALTLAFGRFAAHNLGNFRPISNDEVELMQVGYQLATQGVLGSDMYAGFFGADQHHLWTLPMQHVLDALTFRVLGPGIIQARLVSLVAAVSIIWTVGWLALRWYGLGAALVSEVLLTIWPSQLTDGATGVPLLDVARVARYDVLAVACTWLAIAVLDLSLAQRRWTASRASLSLAGGLAGGAALSQFFGIAALPALLVGAAWSCGAPRRHLWWMVAGAIVIVAPWQVYCAMHASDLAGQLSVYGHRGDFLRAMFYAENVLNEPSRYAHFLTDALPPSVDGWSAVLANRVTVWVLLAGVAPSFAYVMVRSLRNPASRGERLLVSATAIPASVLLLLDQTKTPLYAIALVPTIGLALGAAGSALLRCMWRRSAVIAGGVALLLAAAVVTDAVRAFTLDRVEADRVSSYLELGAQIDAGLTPRGVLLGPERFWWALHDHPYLSLRSLWFQSVVRGDARFADLVSRWRPDSVIVNNNVRDDLQAFPQTLQDQFWKFIADCTTQVDEIVDATYLDIEVYRVTQKIDTLPDQTTVRERC